MKQKLKMSDLKDVFTKLSSSITDHLEQVEKTAQSNFEKIQALNVQVAKIVDNEDNTLGDMVVKNQAKIEKMTEEINSIVGKLQKLGVNQDKLVLDDCVNPGELQGFIDTWVQLEIQNLVDKKSSLRNDWAVMRDFTDLSHHYSKATVFRVVDHLTDKWIAVREKNGLASHKFADYKHSCGIYGYLTGRLDKLII